MGKKFVMTMLALGAVVVAIGCGGDSGDDGAAGEPVDEVIEVAARDIRFVPDEITIPAGKTIRLVLVNEDEGTAHDLEAEGMTVRRLEGGGHPGEHGGGDMLAVHSEEGERSAVVFVAETPGTYEIFCTVLGHRDAGMVGRIIVV
jgi:plastocyanin